MVQGMRKLTRWPRIGAPTSIAAVLPVGVVMALLAVFSFTSDAFLSFRNLTAVASQARACSASIESGDSRETKDGRIYRH
jgi:hypothetical protein